LWRLFVFLLIARTNLTIEMQLRFYSRRLAQMGAPIEGDESDAKRSGIA
jgi:hypothetical protein